MEREISHIEWKGYPRPRDIEKSRNTPNMEHTISFKENP